MRLKQNKRGCVISGALLNKSRPSSRRGGIADPQHVDYVREKNDMKNQLNQCRKIHEKQEMVKIRIWKRSRKKLDQLLKNLFPMAFLKNRIMLKKYTE